jgi:predicted nucleic acid-binding Zn finger protein
MNNSSIDEKKKLDELVKLIQNEGKLSEIAENEMISLFDNRGEKAFKVLKENKLHKHIINEKIAIWEVEGKSQNYLIIEDYFCECTDYQIRVLSRGEKTLCYHLLAKIIGEQLHHYSIKKLSTKEYDDLILSRT